jgi:hypothetical protein
MQRMWGEVETMKRSKVTMDIETLRSITSYCHWIPITQGLHKEFFVENFPGWQWNDFVPRLLKKKILEFNGEGNDYLVKLWQGLYISSDIQFIEFIPDKSGAKINVLTNKEISKNKELETA